MADREMSLPKNRFLGVWTYESHPTAQELKLKVFERALETSL